MAAFDIFAAAHAAARAACGATITYRRGATTWTWLAEIGTTARDQADADGVLTRAEWRDFIVAATDLDTAGITPAVGDQIDQEIDGKAYSHEVSPIGQEGPWRHDRHRTAVRIHTRQIGVT